LDDVLHFTAISSQRRDAARPAFSCELPSIHAELSQVVVTWENHNEIFELFRRANSISLQIADLWQATKSRRLSQDDVDFLTGLMAIQAQLAKALSQAD